LLLLLVIGLSYCTSPNSLLWWYSLHLYDLILLGNRVISIATLRVLFAVVLPSANAWEARLSSHTESIIEGLGPSQVSLALSHTESHADNEELNDRKKG
jgi:hypothetical protein